MPKRNILLAMFDVKPKKNSAGFDLKKIKREINLKPRITRQVNITETKKFFENGILPITIPKTVASKLKPEIKSDSSKEKILQEFETALSSASDITTEVASFGGQLHNSIPTAYRFRRGVIKQPKQKIVVPMLLPAISLPQKPITRKTVKEREFFAEPASPASREVDVWLENVRKNSAILTQTILKKKHRRPVFRIKMHWPKIRISKRAGLYLAGFTVVGLIIFSFARNNTIGVKNNVLSNGKDAIANLEEAKQKLKTFKFLEAADSFALAYDDFNKASSTLNQLGISFISIFSDLPGINHLKTANNLIEAGQNLSKAGENLSLAFGTIYKTNIFSFLSSSTDGRGKSLSKLVSEFKDVLVFADKDIKKANRLLADIDIAAIPEDKQQLFLDFKEKIPEFQKYIGEAVDYSDFLLKLIGGNGTKTYLVLLQNNNELRATGGFPGTYALITFDRGVLKKIFVDDIYQLDSGNHESIIPPIPLRHITADWGLRDANWFADFPTSARKIEEFYKLDSDGLQIDGVLTITPDVITKTLGVIGPIDMPEYGIKLDQDNFLDQIQSEVEYKADRAKPKKIVSDLQPRFFEKLGGQDKDHWLEIFKIILDAVKEKHILAYLDNQDLETTAVKNNFGGEIKRTAGDYLQVVFTNVKGSKTDAVTDNFLDLKINPASDENSDHILTISRTHNGGNSKYGFYNRDNSAYIRVYVPKGSVLKSIKGQSLTNFPPLVDYLDLGFKKDSDLSLLEENTDHPFSGADVYEESGKTVFGFWLITKPKEKKTVVLNYKVPTNDSGIFKMLWQKQSGTGQDPINFSFKLPDGKNILDKSEELQTTGDTLILNSDLSVDRDIKIDFK